MRRGTDATIHVRTVRMVIERHELERMVMLAAIAEAGFNVAATKAVVRFEDVTEGSPSYKVGTYCTVDLTENQDALPQEGKTE